MTKIYAFLLTVLTMMVARVAMAADVADVGSLTLDQKIDSYFKEKVLLEQNFIKDPSVTIRNLEEQAVQKFGEKTKVVRFVRFSV